MYAVRNILGVISEITISNCLIPEMDLKTKKRAAKSAEVEQIEKKMNKVGVIPERCKLGSEKYRNTKNIEKVV